jgi:hypothetical protein
MIYPVVKQTQNAIDITKNMNMIAHASKAPWLSVSGHFRPSQHPIG